MSDEAGTSRYSDPLTERGGYVGRGAVLYDTREPDAKPCCARPAGRCLAHVVGVYEETTTDEIYYKVADGTWTTEEWIHGDDLLAIFEPAGWSVTDVKPTYLLTRQHGAEDHHDLMTDGGQSLDGTEHLPLDYDVDKRYAHVRVEVLGQTFTDAVRVCEQFPSLPDGISVYVEHVDAVDLKDENSDENDCYPRVNGECPECGSRSLFVGKNGYVTCSYIGCPDPSAPSDALDACNVGTDTD